MKSVTFQINDLFEFEGQPVPAQRPTTLSPPPVRVSPSVDPDRDQLHNVTASPHKDKEGTTNPELLRKKSAPAVYYRLDALKRYDTMSVEKIKEIALEIGMVGRNGLDTGFRYARSGCSQSGRYRLVFGPSSATDSSNSLAKANSSSPIRNRSFRTRWSLPAYCGEFLATNGSSTPNGPLPV